MRSSKELSRNIKVNYLVHQNEIKYVIALLGKMNCKLCSHIIIGRDYTRCDAKSLCKISKIRYNLN